MQPAETNPTKADFLTVAQAAEFLGVSPWTLRNWDNSGKLKSLRHPLNGYRMYREEDLRTVLANGHLLGKRRATLAPNVDWNQLEPSEHIVQFYETDAYLVESVSDFLSKGLVAGEGVLLIATGEHRKRIAKNLAARGVDLQAAAELEQFVAIDAAGTLTRFMAGRSPDPQRFQEAIGEAVERLAQKWPRIRAFGEMVALLWAQGDRDAAAELESLWNDLGKRRSFALLCAYPLSAFSAGADAGKLDDVCASHTRVIPAESYASLASSDEQLRAIALLQQKAKALEAEIAQRSEVERELFDFVENAVEGLHKVGPDGRIIWANRTELDLLGYQPDEYIGRQVTEFHVDPEAAEETLARLARGETLRDHPARLRCKDGSIRDVLINSNARFENGAFLYSRCFTRDVTSLKQAQAAQALLAAIVDSSDDAIVSKSLDGVIRSWNAGAERIFGYTAAEVVGQPITLIIPPELHDEERSILARLRRGERVEHFETTRVAKDGRRLNISLTISPVRDADGNIIGASKIGRDITARKQAEERLRQSEERYRRLAELLPVGIYTCDAPSGVITYFNKQAVELWGRAPELGERADHFCGSSRMLLPDGTPLAHEQCPMAVAVREGREFRNQEVVIERPDGSRVTALVNIDPIRDADGRIVGAVNVFHDMTAVKQAKESLREQKENLQTLLDTLPVAVFIAEDPECRRISGNPAAGDFLRLPAGANLSKTAPPGEAPAHSRVFKEGDEVPGEALPIQRAARGEVVTAEAVDLVFDDGSVCHALISARPLLDRAGKPRGAVACVLDVTEIKNAELALREADRRKDEFLATLAHELRNPLAPIRNGLHILQLTKGAGQPEAEKVYEMLDRQVAHMVRLVDDLLELSRISRGKIELRRKPIALATVIAHAVETSMPLIEAAGHQINVTLPDESVTIDGDAVRLGQVFSNLLNNAAKYTDRGGRITVLCTCDGEEAVVSVRDTGIGIPPDMLSRVFEMFAQVPNPLRRTEQGLGIGLSLVRALVTLHDGRVDVYSDGIGQGSEFVVRLPVCYPDLNVSTQCDSLAGAGA